MPTNSRSVSLSLKERIGEERAEIVGGCYVEDREDALLPVETQLWNLLKGLAVSQELLGREVRVFGRQRFGFHPQTPQLLNTVGLNRALLLAFDDSVIPSHRAPRSCRGRRRTASRSKRSLAPLRRRQSANVLPHRPLHAQDDHAGPGGHLRPAARPANPTAPWYRDWLELTRFGPVFGNGRHSLRLLQRGLRRRVRLRGQRRRVPQRLPQRADQCQERGADQRLSATLGCGVRIDTAWTLAAIHRGLTGKSDTLQVRSATVEDRIEAEGPSASKEAEADLEQVEKEAAAALANRLVSRATAEAPGYLVLNPCSFIRRVALELDDIKDRCRSAGRSKPVSSRGRTRSWSWRCRPSDSPGVPLTAGHTGAKSA